MRLDTSKVEFSIKDIKNKIKIPKSMTKELAYLIGVHIGDGTMGLYKNKKDYQISYTGHLLDEKEFHIGIIKPLFKKLFNKETKISFDLRRNHSSLRTYLRSKAIFTFFNRSLYLPLGPKTNCDIPSVIKNSNLGIRKAFLRGLADTEFCLTFKRRYREKHYYPSIKFAIQSRKLKESVLNLLKELGFTPCSLTNYSNYKKNTKTFINTIDLNGCESINLWFRKIGFNSTKHLTKYNVWKKFCFCPPNTNIIERRKILKGEININSYYGPVA